MNSNKNTRSQNAGKESTVSKEEKELLHNTSGDGSSKDTTDLQRSQLDDKDDDGTLLNERSGATDISGEDLDIPGSELDDDNEAIGEEDEENNGYSQADTE